ncbi:oligosaccharide repeat unit polymerase [compost metagenome]
MGLFILFPIVVVISYCLDRFFFGAKRFEYKKLIAAAALVFLASLPMVLLGGRTNLFFGVLALIFSLGIWYLRNKRRGELGRLVRVGVFFLGGALIGANLLGAIREAVMSSSSDYSMHSEQKIPLEGVVLAMSSYENVYILFDQKFDAYRYGATIFAATLGLIPRSIFPEKPIGAGPVMKNIISPNSYDLSGGENISSVTTGLPAEGYINFGWMGALIVPIIMLPLLWFASWMNSRASNSIEIVVGAFIFLRVMSYVNGEFFGVSLHIMMTLLILLSCKFLLKNVPRVKFHRN